MSDISFSPLMPNFFIAVHSWLDGQGYRPMIECKLDKDCKVPRQFSNNTEILFNLSSEAIAKFKVDEIGVSFHARFSGREEYVFVPLSNTTAITCKEASVYVPAPFNQVLRIVQNGENSVAVPVNIKHLVSVTEQSDMQTNSQPQPAQPVVEKKKNPFTLIKGGKSESGIGSGNL